jgi:hypothetical protein
MSSVWLVAALMAQAAPSQAPVAGPPASAPVSVHGELSTLVAGYPNQDGTRELRTRASINATADHASWLRLRFDGLAEGLLGNGDARGNDAILAVRDAWVELRLKNAEVRAGYGRLVWGRLDEIMPSDVINPIDTARFFLDGRAEARLPIAFVRSRVFLPSETTVETVVALPGRRGRFDSLDEATSPFNLLRDLVLPATAPGTALIRREEPSASWKNLQGGLRVSTTAGRVDMSVSAWRGFEGFGQVGFGPVAFPVTPGGPIPTVVGTLVERYPRFTMVAGDAEMVQGGWAIRGEVAAFIDKTLTGLSGPEKGRAIDAGVGVDRSAGDYHLFGSVVWHREWFTTGSADAQQHFNIIASVDRRFAMERYMLRLFGVLNPDDRSGFIRGLASWSIRDNVLLEASGGAFLGEGMDTISRFAERDFFFLRLKYSF